MIDDIRKIGQKKKEAGTVCGARGEVEPMPEVGYEEEKEEAIGQLIKIMSATESSREALVR